MTVKKLIIGILVVFFNIGFSQNIPRKMMFADMELKIEDDAAEIISTRIKKLTASPKFFSNLKSKFELHAPLIQKVLAENQVPDEFKYLCVMESSINPSAVSTSNAVGYWQFKKESGVEVGLKIDHLVDERKNIVASTTAACKYLKRSQTAMNNWILACQSYNVGLGGTKRSVDNALFGEKKMVINGKTHEYVTKFLAYVILFNQNPPSASPPIVLLQYDQGQNKTLDEIAEHTELNKEEVRSYNLWLQCSRIPDDKPYAVILPVPADKTSMVLQKLNMKQTANNAVIASNTPTNEEAPAKPSRKKWWQIFGDRDEDQLNGTDVPVFMNINGIRAIQAKPGDNSHKLANQGEIKYKRFLRYNEMRTFDELIPGRFYYLDSKKEEASILFHTVMPNESLWDISQKYGVSSESIKEKNRMDDGEALVLGRKLYLRFARPEHEAVIIEPVKLPEAPRDTIIKINREVVRDTIVKIDTVIHRVIVKEPAKTETILDPKGIHDLEERNTPLRTEVQNTYHTVEQGQTMYFISRKYSSPIDSITTWNNLSDNNLKIGSSLLVKKLKANFKPIDKPAETAQVPPAGSGTQHIVQAGETLYGIARKYGVVVSEIMKANQLSDNALKQGMVLEIPKKQ